MSVTLKDVLVASDSLPEVEEHRIKNEKVARPTEEVDLLSVSKESIYAQRTQLDPTKDLITIDRVFNSLDEMTSSGCIAMNGYLVWCARTEETWFAPTKLCIDQNFIYREDLEIFTVDNLESAWQWHAERGNKVNYGVNHCKKCYILDNPGNETYEVYFDSNYPALRYGKSTPQGCVVHQYPNRFHRDMAILRLDELYSNSSNKRAGELTTRKFAPNEAIIISDGAWMREVCSFAYVYLDDRSVIQCVEGTMPTEPDQAVLIAEISGAYSALKRCVDNRKSVITYYYDNTSILNVFKNRKTEYIEEVKRYKDLLTRMDTLGYKVTFVELHPKTGEDRADDNKALTFFHNRCDSLCREMSDIVKKDYKAFAVNNKPKDSKPAKTVIEESKPKPKNNNFKGYNRYR